MLGPNTRVPDLLGVGRTQEFAPNKSPGDAVHLGTALEWCVGSTHSKIENYNETKKPLVCKSWVVSKNMKTEQVLGLIFLTVQIKLFLGL